MGARVGDSDGDKVLGTRDGETESPGRVGKTDGAKVGATEGLNDVGKRVGATVTAVPPYTTNWPPHESAP